MQSRGSGQGTWSEPVWQPNPSKPGTLKSLVVLKVPLVSPKCTFVGNSKGEKPAECVLFSLHSSGLGFTVSVDETPLIYLDGSIPGFLL